MQSTEVRSLPEAVYTAENLTISKVARRFDDFRSIEDFVEQVITDPWWELKFPAAPLHVHIERRSSSSHWSVAHGNTIALANNPQGRSLSTVLHELAHVATAQADGHGPIFRGALLKLVRRYMGFYAYVALKEEYRRQMSN